jgi:hypothetical protein
MPPRPGAFPPWPTAATKAQPARTSGSGLVRAAATCWLRAWMAANTF